MAQLERHHATLFLDPAFAGPVEELRRRWDPVMHRQIAAHVSLLYPGEAADPSAIGRRVSEVAPGRNPFVLRLGAICHAAYPEGDSCWFAVEDPDGEWEQLRLAIASTDFSPLSGSQPHVTIVHPRTSRQGRAAWEELRSQRVDLQWSVREVAITAWDGWRWRTIEVTPLEG